MSGASIQQSNRLAAIVFCIATVCLASCGKEDPLISPGIIVNTLRFGTGIAPTGTDLTGETRTFTVTQEGSNTIFFQVVYEQELTDKQIHLELEKLGVDGTRIQYRTVSFNVPENAGHTYVGSFIMIEPGLYYITAKLAANPDITIASENITLM